MPVTSQELFAKKISKKIPAFITTLFDLSEVSQIIYELSDAKEVLNFIKVDELKIMLMNFSRKYSDEKYDKNINEMTKDEIIDEIDRLVKGQKYYIECDEGDMPTRPEDIICQSGCSDCSFCFYIYRMSDIESFDNLKYDKTVLSFQATFEIQIIESNNDADVIIEDLKFELTKNCSNEEFINIFKFIKKNKDVISIFLNNSFISKFNYDKRVISFLQEIYKNIKNGKLSEDEKVITKSYDDDYQTYG